MNKLFSVNNIKYITYLFRFLLLKITHPNISNGFIVIEPNVTIKGSRINLGNFVELKQNCSLNCINDGVIDIGDYSSIGRNTIFASNNRIVVGKHCLIAPNSFITDHNHNYKDVTKLIRNQGLTKNGFVEIDDNVWIGNGVTLLPNTKIGYGSVVAANSVVKGRFPKFSLIAGSPAKTIKIFDRESNDWIKIVHQQE